MIDRFNQRARLLKRTCGILAALVFAPMLATAGWEHQVRILTDVPGAWVHVDGTRVAALDNSTFSSDEEKFDDRGRGGYGAYVDLKDFERHRIHVGTSPSVLSDSGFIMFAMRDTPTLSRFVPLKSARPTVPPPSGSGVRPMEPPTGQRVLWQDVLYTVNDWVSTPQGAVALVLAAALFLAVALIVAVARRDRRGSPAVVNPSAAPHGNQVHVPTIIGHGWPYVMFEKYPSISPVQKIGAGGVASVFLAEVPKHGHVAIKILHDHQSTDEDLRQRFLQEARVLRKLAVTGVVPIAYGMSPKQFPRPWFTMSYLGNMYRLRDMIGGNEHKQLTLDWAYPVAAALCSSVEAIHRAGVIHRDLSPENVMYGFGSGMEVRLIDFDSAKMQGTNLSRFDLVDTSSNCDVVGKVKYTSPEQWQDFDSAGTESDAYSVGVMIWEMITGAPPFLGTAIDEIREQHLSARREISSLTRCGVPGQLATLLASLLNPNSTDRPELSLIRSRILATIGGNDA